MEQSLEVSSVIQSEITNCVDALRRGHVIVYPSDTIWGIGCDLLNESAVSRVYEIKQRSREKPLLLLVESIAMLKNYIKGIHPRVETLLTHHTKPLTIIYEASAEVPPYLLNEEQTIGVRVVSDPFCASLIGAIKKPLISTSANIAGEPYPKNFDEINPKVLELADYVVDQSLDRPGPQEPSVIATYNKKGELDFIRL